MGVARKVAKNTILYFIFRMIARVLNLLTMIIIARILLPDLFGQYSLALIFIAFFLFLNDFGVQTVVTRKLSVDEKNAKELLGNTLSLKIILSVFSIIACIIFANLLGYTGNQLFLIYVFALTLFTGGVSSVFTIIFQTRLKMGYPTLAEAIQAAVALGLVIILSLQGLEPDKLLIPFVLIMVASNALALILNWLFSLREIKIIPKINFPMWKNLLLTGLPFAFSAFFVAFYTRIDIIMLSKMSTEASIGLYTAAFRLTEPFFLIPAALLISLFPLMSRYYKQNKRALITTHDRGFKYLSILFVPFAVGITILAARILFIIYQQDYATPETTFALAILAWAALVNFLNFLSINLMNSIRKEVTALKVITGGIIVNVALNFLLIPIMGFGGAAITTLASELLLFVLFYYIIHKSLYTLNLKIFIKPAIASVVMALFLLFFIEINLWILIPLGAVVYFISFYLLKGFSAEDFEIMGKIVRMKS